MAKNEAKIKFSAETGEFNQAIQKANSEMTELRAEMKLNATQMKATGATVEGLESKHSILAKQLEASESKTEALSQKVQKAVEIFGENSTEASKLRTQLLNAQTAEEKLRQAVSQCANELEDQRAAARQTEDATESLTDKIARQEGELAQLKSAYIEAVAQYGKTSKEAKDLGREIKELSSDLRESQTDFNKADRAADKLDKSLDNAGDAARDSADGFTVAKGAVADLASSAIQAAIGKVTEFISYLRELPEATREIRQDMATLETSFEGAGLTTEQATNTWKELYTVFGEDDRAVEAANLIAKMSKNQEDLNDWVTITTGIFGEYQDSLPVEGLAEASNETAKTGKVTGVLADALNWSSEAASMFAGYMGDDVTTAEDAFNVALAECTTEQERQALITETLTKLYGGAADKFEEASGSQLAAKEATAEATIAQNELANAIEPVTTAWDGLKTELIVAVTPAIQGVCDGLQDALAWLKEHPAAAKAVAVAVGILALGIGGLAIGMGVYAAAQWLANSAMFAFVAPILAVIAVIALIGAAIVVVIHYWDDIVAACGRAWEGVKATLAEWGTWIDTNVIQPVKSFFSGLWSDITSAASTAWEGVTSFFAGVPGWFDTNVIQPVISFFTGLWDGIKAVWDGICNAVSIAIKLIGSILSAAFQIITLPFMFIWENCKQYVFAAWEWIKQKVTTGVNAVKSVITVVFGAVKTVFSTVWNGIKSIVGTVWDWIKNKVTVAVNSVKSVVTTVWNAVKSVTTSVFNSVKSVVTTVWNGIKNAVTTVVNAVKTRVTAVWNGIKSATSTAFNAVKSVATSVWNGIRGAISNVVNGIKSTVSRVWNGVRSTTSNVFNSLRSTVSGIWNRIKTAITTPIESAKNKIKGIIDTIKDFFSGMKISWPKIKMPHFGISPSGWKIGDLLKGKIPKLKIDWYAEGGIMTKPTIFGMNGNRLMAGGEAGAEAILPIDRLEGYITGAIERAQNVVNLDTLANAIEELASRPVSVRIGDREIAVATAGASDSVNGLRSTFKSRGLVLD